MLIERTRFRCEAQPAAAGPTSIQRMVFPMTLR
jgi:hypothetical protein